MIAGSFTKRQSDVAEAHGTNYALWSGDTAGFGLWVQPSGRKTFVLKYRVGGRQRFCAMGAYGALTMDAARNRTG